MKVCIDAGHGGGQPGAVNGNTGLQEKDVNLQVALQVGRVLTSAGVEVVYTRTSDTTVELNERTAIANNNKCDLFVSIHDNSLADPSAHGTETWCYKVGDKGEALAKVVNAEVIDLLHLANRGVKYCGNNLYVIAQTNMPAILVEVAFISNANEERILADPNMQIKIGTAIANGILKFIGLSPVNTEPVVQPTPQPPAQPVVAPILQQLPVGYMEFLPGRTIFHVSKDVYISLDDTGDASTSGIYVYNHGNSKKMI